MVFRRGPYFHVVLSFHDFSCFFDLAFCRHPFLGVLFLDLGGFGRFRGPPKSTLDLQNDTFYDGASTILKKTFFFITKSGVQKNMFFYHFWTSKNLPKSVPGPPRFAQDAPKAPRTLPRPPKRPLWHRFWRLQASVLEAPGLRLGCSQTKMFVFC